MRKCTSCGFHNFDTRDRCLKCRALLVTRVDLVAPVARPRVNLNPLYAVRRSWERARRTLGRALAVPLPQGLPHRQHFLAAFLALAPGLGQLYNHQPRKVLYLLPPFVACIVLAVRYITTPYIGNLCISGAIVVSMASYTDALITAATINGQYFTLRNKLAALTYPFFLLGLFLTILSFMTYAKWPVLTLFRMNYDYMAPELCKGDRVAGEALIFIFREPRPGDVVRYDPPQYSASVGSGDYLINPANGWERILAVGGETLERRDGVFYVNGKRLSEEYYPVVTKNLPRDFRIECPAGKYIVLISARVEDTGFINQLRGGNNQAPDLGGEKWEKACIVEKGTFLHTVIFERTLCIYHPAEHRRWLVPRGPRFLSDAEFAVPAKATEP